MQLALGAALGGDRHLAAGLGGSRVCGATLGAAHAVAQRIRQSGDVSKRALEGAEALLQCGAGWQSEAAVRCGA